MLAGAACDATTTETATETLAPLPAPRRGPVTTAAGSLAPRESSTGVATTTTAARPTTTVALPTGDWDGARFDAGRIVDDDQRADGYHVVVLDRFSYRHPTVGLVDAAGFTEEPLAAWWREDPFVNNQTVTREFVLAPDAELLVLSDEGEDEACADPPPPAPPEPVWEDVDVAFLRTSGARGAVAVITYAPDGTITRLRLTHGCAP